jgi:hypothetical protein
MLIPITREKVKELIPIVATAEQYRYYWGKPADVLGRVLISLLGALLSLALQLILPPGFEILEFSLAIVFALYWLWQPAYRAGRRNVDYRRYQYGGFWRGEVIDVFITEELIGKEETVNKQGELVVIENRERRLNLDLEDDTGFTTSLQVPLQRDHRVIRAGDVAEMLVMSNRPDLSRIMQVSDVYLSDYGAWVSDYPHLKRDTFVAVSRELGRELSRRGAPKPPPRKPKRSQNRR